MVMMMIIIITIIMIMIMTMINLPPHFRSQGSRDPPGSRMADLMWTLVRTSIDDDDDYDEEEDNGDDDDADIDSDCHICNVFEVLNFLCYIVFI